MTPKMNFIIAVSVFALTGAVRVPNAWQANNFENVFAAENRPVSQQSETLLRSEPNYLLNNINTYSVTLPSTRTNELLNNPNLQNNVQGIYNTWLPVIQPTNSFNFNSQLNPNEIDYRKLLSNNAQGNNLIGVIKKPFIPQQQSLPRFLQPPKAISNPQDLQKHIPQLNPVQYITFTTPRPISQLSNQDAPQNINTYAKSQPTNVKEAYPQLNSPTPTSSLVDLDFNPYNPFPPRKDNQITPQANKPFSTAQPVTNLDFSLNSPFSFNLPKVTASPQLYQLPVTQVYTTPSTRQPLSNLDFDPNNPFTKNYRDHKTHEPSNFEPHYGTEAVPKVQRLEHEKAPVSDHENPDDVPTKPIYPGEGQWAKPGLKHRPFISQHKYTPLEESKQQPDGYDTFLEGQKLFESQKNEFGQKLQEFPSKHPSTSQINEGSSEEQKDIFVPTRLYAQVRHSEDEEHLPPESDENGRLKELIRDSKIQTVYSEEGFEDSAYDHAGHEKKAENAENFAANEKKLKADKEKNQPASKHNLHLPVTESSSYSIGDINLKEEDIERLKNEELGLEEEDEDDGDSEPAGTNHKEQALGKGKPRKKALSSKTKYGDKNSFIKSKEIKTVTAKDKGKGNMEMEISTEVKVVVQPNNSTKSHKYVKIYPKVYKTINKDKTTESPVTTVAPTEYAEIYTVEIPATTQATTAIPKIESQKTFRKAHSRRKREVAGIPKIEVDTDFIDNINHELGPAKVKDTSSVKAKYPYYDSYKQKGLHENSPLRYSEDMKNIPVKIDNNLAFYSLADKKMECPDVNPEVDPVPDRIKEAEDGVEDEDEEAADVAGKSPRLGQLGDKIDCLKNKFFGENPFDSPFFEEELVGPVKPIFKEIDSTAEKIVTVATTNENAPSTAKSTNSELKVSTTTTPQLVPKASGYEENEIDDGRLGKRDDFFPGWFPGQFFSKGENTKSVGKNANAEEKQFSENPKNDAENINLKEETSPEAKKEVHTLPPATLITTPMYTIKLKPKHIYDQIVLLDHLPDYDEFEAKKENIADMPKRDPELPKRIPENVLHTPEKPIEKPKKQERRREENTKKEPPRQEKVLRNKPKENRNMESSNDTPKSRRKERARKEPTREAKVLRYEEQEHMKMETSDDAPPESPFQARKEPGREAKALRYKEQEHMKMETSDDTPPESLFQARKQPVREAKVLRYEDQEHMKMETSDDVPPESLPEADAWMQRSRRKKPKRPLYQVFDVNKFLPQVPKIPYPTPDARYSSPTVKYSYPMNLRNPTVQIFDINEYLPTTPYPIISDIQERVSLSTVLPKYKVISEVFYKDEIKPNEQLNVLTDIMNNIKSFPKLDDDFFQDSSDLISVKLNSDKDSKGRLKDKKNAPSTTVTTTTRTTTTTTVNPGEYTERQRILHRNHKLPQYTMKRRRIKTTTVAVPQVVEETTPLIEGVLEESTQVMGLMPPGSFEYKTIYHPKRDNSAQVSNLGRITYTEKKINKYLVPGMKPPPKQKAYNYSDFLTDNHIRSRTDKPRRSKREANRPAYAEVARTRGSQKDDGKDIKDDDDYVPHRPKTYHYDEKTGQIIYDKKPEEPKGDSEEEIVYEEITEAPHTTTTEKPKQNPIFATATPPPEGQSYTDFVQLLKTASNYHEIPDPTTTEKGAEVEKATTTTLKPLSTTPPEFLSILAKVRDSSSYKAIEDKKKTTTTPAPEEDEVVEEESQVENVKNSPGGQGYEDIPKWEIFDITDYLPNVKSYLPKTPIDTSKYTSIQRPATRHNLSSRYNSEEDTELQNVNTSKQPIISNSEEEGVKKAEETRPTTEKPATPRILRARKRPTTERSVEASQEVGVTTSSPDTEQVQHEKARRKHRRRPSRIRRPNPEEDQESTTKSTRRRSQRDSGVIDENGNEYEEVPETSRLVKRMDDYTDYEEADVKAHQNYSKVVSEENSNNKSGRPLPDIALIAKKVVEIFRDYDKAKKHGGNYKKEEDAQNDKLQEAPSYNPNKIAQTVDTFKQYDKTKKHGGNYKYEKDELVQDPVPQRTEARKIDVETFKAYDKTKKHGGNYKSENEDVAQLKEQRVEPKQIVDSFIEFDKNKKHGGNYKPEDEEIEQIQELQRFDLKKTDTGKNENVETFKDYDKTKKHGGNYRPEEVALPLEQQSEESQFVSPKENSQTRNRNNIEVFKKYDQTKKHGGNYKYENKDLQEEKQNQGSGPVEVFKKFDETKKHGGNYRREHEDTEEQSNGPVLDRLAVKDVEVFDDNYDKVKKHGGNYKRENEEEVDAKVEETQHGYPKQNTFYSDKTERLTDVVHKPDAFYTDTQLPNAINALILPLNLSNEELEEIVASVEADQQNDQLGTSDKEEVPTKQQPVVPIVATTTESVKDIADALSEASEKILPTKKPLFIKDPGKRLYFYAPLR